MKKLLGITIPFVLAGSLSVAQNVPPGWNADIVKDSSYYPNRFIVGDGVSAPELLPMSLSVAQEQECKDRLNSVTTLSFLVSADGIPKNIAFEHGSGSGLDELARRVASVDRFKPAIHDGTAVTVPMKAEVELDACTVDMQSPDGKTQTGVKPRLPPKQKFTAMSSSQADLEFIPIENLSHVGHSEADGTKSKVTDPVPLNSVSANFSDEARKKKISGTCLVTMIVDTGGIPRNVRVKRALGYGLDEQAVEAARKYRFKPAVSAGVPVPMVITVEIKFRLY